MKITKPNKSKRGFSLTEIILVFAIGSTVTVGVFLSIGAFKRNARDRERMTDRDTIAVAFKAYASAHDGTLPAISDTDDPAIAIWRLTGSGKQDIKSTSPLVTNGYLTDNEALRDPLARNADGTKRNYRITSNPTAPECVSTGPNPNNGVSETDSAIIWYNQVNSREFNLGICLETRELNIQNYGS